MNLVGFNYENRYDKELSLAFIESNDIKKYILGINSFTKSILKHIEVDGIIDDFTRVQSSRKKEILQIQDVPKDSIILSVSTGSPLEVYNKLNDMGYKNFNYLSFYRYSGLSLKAPPFMDDFKDDFITNTAKYEQVYSLLCDNQSKYEFIKVLNFKMTFDLNFMDGFTNNHEGQYFDLEYLPKFKNICFLDGGGYVGDTLPSIIKNYPDYKKIYVIEPNSLHINIAKRDFKEKRDIEFINVGLGSKENYLGGSTLESGYNCNHNYQAINTDTIDNLIKEKIDFIKLDIEGAEQDTIKGAKNTIKKYRPVLAICIYHKAEDWHKIPAQVLEIDPTYKIYFRHYMEGIYESVLYFI